VARNCTLDWAERDFAPEDEGLREGEDLKGSIAFTQGFDNETALFASCTGNEELPCRHFCLCYVCVLVEVIVSKLWEGRVLRVTSSRMGMW
jgi:hypothetical protein